MPRSKGSTPKGRAQDKRSSPEKEGGGKECIDLTQTSNRAWVTASIFRGRRKEHAKAKRVTEGVKGVHIEKLGANHHSIRGGKTSGRKIAGALSALNAWGGGDRRDQGLALGWGGNILGVG